MKKKGLEISINFLVMIIISLVIFIFALTFAFRFFGQAEEYQKKVDQNTRQQIQDLIINQGQRVAAYPTQTDLYPSKDEVIGLGVYSIGFNGPKTFNLFVNCTKYIYANGSSAEPDIIQEQCSNSSWTVLYSPTSVDLKPEGDYVFTIYIKNKGAWRGTYIFNGVVTVDNGIYGSVQKIYVNAK